eukprot:11744349-Alexandrium_andersonii.AAC.1
MAALRQLRGALLHACRSAPGSPGHAQAPTGTASCGLSWAVMRSLPLLFASLSLSLPLSPLATDDVELWTCSG